MDIKDFILMWEGGYANIEGDAGGPTCSGVTLATYRQYFGEDKTEEDLRNITRKEWDYIFTKAFWDRLKCPNIKDENIRDFLVDWS